MEPEVCSGNYCGRSRRGPAASCPAPTHAASRCAPSSWTGLPGWRSSIRDWVRANDACRRDILGRLGTSGPILYGDALVGELDATADRTAGVLRVHAIHQDVPFTKAATAEIGHEVRDLAHWLELDLTPTLPFS